MTNAGDTLRVGILLFDGVEVLDFAGPFEVFSIAGLLTDGGFSVSTVAADAKGGRLVSARSGLKVVPDYGLADAPPLQIMIIPGGKGTRREVSNVPLLEWIRSRAAEVTVTASVCTGAFLLAEAGLLDGKRATTHWASLQRLRESYPQVKVVDGRRVIDEGAVASSAGVSAGIDLSLHLVSRLKGEQLAARTARQMEYEFHPIGG